MPLLTPEQDALADTLTHAALDPKTANNLDALKECLDSYVVARHGFDSLGDFWEYNISDIDDPFVSGQTWEEEDDERFSNVLKAALNPDNYHGVQADMAKLLGRFVFCSNDDAQHGNPSDQWDEVLVELMDQPNYRRLDLCAAFFVEKRIDDFNRILKWQQLLYRRSLYNWLLVIDACWETQTKWRNGRFEFGTNVMNMNDDDFKIQNQGHQTWLRDQFFPKLHFLFPETPDPEEPDDKWVAYECYSGFDASPVGMHPPTVLKLEMLR